MFAPFEMRNAREKMRRNRSWLGHAYGESNTSSGAADGAAMLTIGQLAQVFIQLLGAFILARLLEPQDFGLIAMATTVTVIATHFSELGLASSIIQSPRLRQSVTSALFIITGLAGVGVALLCAIASRFVASFFDDARLTALVIVMACAIPFYSLSAVHRALLTKARRWVILQKIPLISQIIGLLSALAGVALGVGYWALAAQFFVTGIMTCLLTWWFCSWRPNLRLFVKGADHHFRFGVDVMTFGLLNWLHRQGDNIVIGWRWGAEILGYYSRAYSLYMIPLGIISGPLKTVCLPILSGAADDNERWAEGALYVIKVATLLGVIISLMVGVGAKLLILTILGEGWEESIAIFRWLSISFIAASPLSLAGAIMMSKRHSRRLVISGFVNCSLLFLVYVFSVDFGAQYVAGAYSFAYCALLIPTIWYAVKGTSLTIGRIIAHLWPLFALAIVLQLMGFALDIALPNRSLFEETLYAATTSLIAAALSFSLCKFHPHYTKILTDATQASVNMVGRVFSMHKLG